jgi:drug/metabolite transporter (DMT)-like permease
VTVSGDLSALAASLCFVGYLLVGKRLRTWMPTFVYAFM